MPASTYLAALAACLLLVAVGSLLGSWRTQGRPRRDLRIAAVVQAVWAMIFGTLAFIWGALDPSLGNLTSPPLFTVVLGILAVASLGWFAVQFRLVRQAGTVRDERQETR